MTKAIRETLAKLDEAVEMRGDEAAAKAAAQIRQSQREVARMRRERLAREKADRERRETVEALLAAVRGGRS